MELAELVSSWSKDPSTQVGAVIVDDSRRILATGYNGLPSVIDDDLFYELMETKEEKYQMTIHAEMNGLLNASRHGVSVVGASLYIFGLYPCCDCAKHIAQAGITRVYYRLSDETKYNIEKWKDSFALTKKLFSSLEIKYQAI